MGKLPQKKHIVAKEIIFRKYIIKGGNQFFYQKISSPISLHIEAIFDIFDNEACSPHLTHARQFFTVKSDGEFPQAHLTQPVTIVILIECGSTNKRVGDIQSMTWSFGGSR